MVVAIISMAQQARPNCIGQIEFLRPQLYNSLTVVTKTPCLPSSIFKSGSTAMMNHSSTVKTRTGANNLTQGLLANVSCPCQNSLCPGPRQTLGQEQDKDRKR